MGERKPNEAPGRREDGASKANSQVSPLCICEVADKFQTGFRAISPSEHQYL